MDLMIGLRVGNRLEDYLIDQVFYDRNPEAYKVRKLHNEDVSEIKSRLNKLEKFKEWVIYDSKHFMTPKNWDSTLMKNKLNELDLDDYYSDEIRLDL